MILKSQSFAASDAARDADTRAAVESNGYELPPEALDPLPALDETTGSPTPAEQERNVKDYADQVKIAKAKYGEAAWTEAVNQDIMIGQAAQLACLEHPNGAEVIFYLGTHPREAERLGKMSPIRQAAEVGRLSAQLPKPVRVERPPKTDDKTASEISQMAPFKGQYRAIKAAWRDRR